MTESFLHYIWQFQYFSKEHLTTTEGEPINIFNPGIKNLNAGPDFHNARITIGTLEWRGSVEIHIKASGWDDHKHGQDYGYENVILHVVWENNRQIIRSDGSLMPTLELKSRTDISLWNRYRNLYTSAESIPCASSWRQIPDLVKLSMQDKAMASRLEAKATKVMELLEGNLGDWDETCYQLLFRNFGFKVNPEPFFQLARAIPYKIIKKHIDRPLQVEALLFGLAGFLNASFDEDYPNILVREYNLLKSKYSLTYKQLHKAQWRFLRLRPANFPTIRISQLAALLTRNKTIFSSLLSINSFQELFDFLKVEQSSYWNSHYQFEKDTASVPSIGKASINNIIINAVVPLLVAYSITHDDQVYMDRAIDLLHHLPSENNKIIRQWLSMNHLVKNAADSQALIELFNSYCTKKRCLECSIGSYLIRPK